MKDSPGFRKRWQAARSLTLSLLQLWANTIVKTIKLQWRGSQSKGRCKRPHSRLPCIASILKMSAAKVSLEPVQNKMTSKRKWLSQKQTSKCLAEAMAREIQSLQLALVVDYEHMLLYLGSPGRCSLNELACCKRYSKRSKESAWLLSQSHLAGSAANFHAPVAVRGTSSGL